MFIAPVNRQFLPYNPQNLKTCNTFGANKIYDVNIKTITPLNSYDFKQAEFCEVDNNNLEDARNIYNLNETWNKTLYGTSFISNFLGCGYNNPRENRFFILRTNLEGSEEILTAAMLKAVHKEENYLGVKDEGFEIMYLQAAPYIENRSTHRKSCRAIKGAGEIMMYSIIKLAKMEGAKFVTLESTNDPFYDKIKLPHKKPSAQIYTSIYIIHDYEFDNFLYRVEQKYNLRNNTYFENSKRKMSA